MMKTAKVSIAGRQYTINELPRKQNAAWRDRVQGLFDEVTGEIRGLPEQEIGSRVGAADLIESLTRRLTGSVDVIVDLIFSYAPEFGDDAQRINEEAYDSEILEAFWAVAKLAFPFGSLIQRVSSLTASGQKADQTGESSRKASGGLTPKS